MDIMDSWKKKNIDYLFFVSGSKLNHLIRKQKVHDRWYIIENMGVNVR